MALIPLHKEYLAPNTVVALSDLISSGSLQTENVHRHACSEWLLQNIPSQQVYLTSSCTDALEMAALTLDLKPNDEVIVPSYTYVSTANAFHLRTSRILFADCLPEQPVVDIQTILPLITPKTKAIVVMHYAGLAVDMNPLKQLCHQKNIALIEDAAHAFGASYFGKTLGSIGTMGCYSFHHTKLISCGEGGCLFLNDPNYLQVANQVYEKGTNRILFRQQHVDRYEWQGVGSSFTMSALQSCVLLEQLQLGDQLVADRKRIWSQYQQMLEDHSIAGRFQLPHIKPYQGVNGSYYYIVLENKTQREALQLFLAKHDIQSAFHYPALHRSPYGKTLATVHLPNAERFEQCLLRLPIYHGMTDNEQSLVCESITQFYKR